MKQCNLPQGGRDVSMLQLIKHKVRVRVLICVVLISSVSKVSDYEIISVGHFDHPRSSPTRS